MRLRSVLFILGALTVCLGLSLLPSMLVSLLYGEYDVLLRMARALLLVVSCGMAAVLVCRPRGENIRLGNREGVAIVGLCWLTACLAGAVPFVWVAHMSWTDAFFEAASGFTTTGATILTDIEILPRGLLFWCSQTQWMGGMGIIVFSLALLPFLGAGGMQMYKAEVTGPVKDKVAPRLSDTARSLWLVYLLLTSALILLLKVEGMDWYDAVNHAFAAMATGGFSTRNASVAAFPSPFIQWTLILFMFLAGINFSLHYLALCGRPGAYRHNTECVAYTLLTLLGGLVIAGLLMHRGGSFEPSLRAAFFQVVSLCTTTGFVTEDYSLWPLLSQGLLYGFILMGASAASTAGGLKVMRVVMLWRMARLEIRRLIHPRAVERVKMNGRSVAPEVLQGAACFFVLFLGFNFVGGLALMALGQDFVTAFSAASTCLSNVGPGFAAVGPVNNFAFLPDAALWLLSFLMVLGRLEIFTLLLLFLPAFWRS